MKAKIWVLCTVLTDENAPAMPAVFAGEAEARAAYDKALRAEWDSCTIGTTAVRTPGNPDNAQIRSRRGAPSASGAQSAPLLDCTFN
jgi:hypothetical protein